ncbi:MAG: hypothetical protein ACQKBY_09200 [Verrucomicrobiales bacterium]
MIQQVLFYKLTEKVDESLLREAMRDSRRILLRIPEVLSVHSGRSIPPESDWPFTVILEFESLAKKKIAEDDPNYLKYLRDVVEEYTISSYDLVYETDPSMDLKYS